MNEPDDTARLVRLASFAARTRTAVERDGYSSELLVMPQPEGPARLVKVLSRLHAALTVIGTDAETRAGLLGADRCRLRASGTSSTDAGAA